MGFNSFFFIIGETIKGLYRNRWMCITSTGVVTVTLFMLGIFMLINLNAGHIFDQVKGEVEIVIWIDDRADAEEVEELYQKLAMHPELESVRFISKEEHLEALQLQMGGKLEGYEKFEDNPLQESYEVRALVPEAVFSLAEEFTRYPAVDFVDYGRDYVEKLFAVINVIQMVGLGLMAGLSITAIFLISHTIKLTVMMRQREIVIMKYVGATNWFIRWPFFLEGLAMGFIGAVLPLIGLYYMYEVSVDWVAANNILIWLFMRLLPVEEVIYDIAKYLVPLGAGLGMLGSSFSIGRFLRV